MSTLFTVQHALSAMGIHTAANRVEQAPFAYDHREVFAHFGDHRHIRVLDEIVIAFHGLRATHHFGSHQILMGVKNHVFEFRRKPTVFATHEILPLIDVETVMEHHGLACRQCTLILVAQTMVCGDIEVLQPVECDRASSFSQFRIDSLISFGHIHHRPRRSSIRLVDDFNAHQRLFRRTMSGSFTFPEPASYPGSRP